MAWLLKSKSIPLPFLTMYGTHSQLRPWISFTAFSQPPEAGRRWTRGSPQRKRPALPDERS
nr:MAG TPA: hypothetical protein [Caudoviricetes sp.]